MPLDLSAITDYAKVTADPKAQGRLHPVTNMIVWMSMVCGFDEITSANIDQIIDRIMAYQHAIGPAVHVDGEALYLTPTDIRLHKGLKTASKALTQREFFTKLGEMTVSAGFRPDIHQPGCAHAICNQMASSVQPAYTSSQAHQTYESQHAFK